MMKNFLFSLRSLLVVALVCCFGFNAMADETTVYGNGTNSSSYLPIYGSWCDSYTRTQSLYAADVLAEAGLTPGASITGLTYYISTSDTSAFTAQFEVALVETTASNLSSGYVSLDDGATVLTGTTFDCTGANLVITFTTPYVYNGGNLVIDIHNLTKGNYLYPYFAGFTSSVSGSSRYGYNSNAWSSATGTANAFIPKVTFEYEASKSSCPRVDSLKAENVTAYGAELSWQSEAPAFELNVNGAISIETATSKTLTLAPFKKYNVAVRAICAEGDTSSVRSFSFSTPKTCAKPDSIWFGDATVNGDVVLNWSGDANMYFLKLTEGYTTLYNDRVGANSLVLTDLAPGFHNISYTLSAQCGAYAYQQSDTLTGTLKLEIPCEAVAQLPWSEGFENMTTGNSSSEAPACWALINANNGSYPYVYVNNYSHSGDNSLYFYNYGTKKAYAVMPEFNCDLTGAKLVFWYKNNGTSSSYGSLNVGYVTDITADSSFVSLLSDELEKTSNWTEVEISLATLPTDARLCFRLSGSTSYSYTGVDDIKIVADNGCRKIKDITVGALGQDTAQIVFTPNEPAAEYAVVVINGEDTIFNQTVQDTAFVLTNLTPATAYSVEVQVVAVCSATAQSDIVSKSLTFNTQLPPLTAPWYEDFESYSSNTVPTGWNNTSTSSDFNSYPHYCWGVFHDGSNNSMRMNNYSLHTGDVYTTSPSVILPAGKEWLLDYDYDHSSTAGSMIISVSTDNGATFEAVDTITKITSTYYSYAPVLVHAETINLSKYAGQSIILQFYAHANYGSGAIWVDNISISEMPTCFKPTSASVVSKGIDNVVVAWTPAEQGGNQFEVLAINDADTLYNGIVNDTLVTINGLTPATSYNLSLSIVTVCDANDKSAAFATSLSFVTDVAPITAPWHENFESYAANSIPTGWDNSATTSSSLSNNPAYCWGVFAYSGNNSMRMNNYYGQAGEMYTVSPSVVLPANSHFALDFDYDHSSTGGNLIVSITTDGGTSWTELASIAKNTTTYYSSAPVLVPAQTIDLSAYAGESIKLQFHAHCNYGSGAIWIDNIAIAETPTCFPVSNIQLKDSSITTTSATIEWTAPEQGGNNFQVLVRNGEDTLYNALVADTALVLTNLTPATSYALNVEIVTVCDTNDMSKPATQALSFNTECAVLSDSYFTGFEDGKTLCWDLDNGISVSSYYAYEGSYSLKFSSTGSLNALLPEFDDINGKRLTVQYNSGGTSSGFFLLGYVVNEKDSLDNDVETFVALTDSVPQVSSYTELYCDYVSVPAGARAAIHYYGASYTYYYGYIDNVELAASPTCFQVSDIHVVDSLTTTNSVSFAWNAGASETEYDVTVVLNGDTLATETVQGTAYTLNGLDHSTNYSVILIVASNCGNGDLSKAVAKSFYVTTECGAIKISYYEPYVEVFDGLKADTLAGQGCFGGWTIGGTSTWKTVNNNVEHGTYTSYMNAKVNFAVDTVRTAATLVLPALELKAGKSYSISLWAKGTYYPTEDTLTIYLNDSIMTAVNAQELGGCWKQYTDTFAVPATGEYNFAFEYASFFGYSFELDDIVIQELYQFEASTFEDVTLDENGLYRPNQDSGFNFWESGSQTFLTYADKSERGTYYYDIVVSSLTDNTFTADYTPGYDLKSACGGAAEGNNYAVWYNNWYNATGVSIGLRQPEVLTGMYVTNNTYAVNSILNGDSYAKKFETGDWFKLTVNGYIAVINDSTKEEEPLKVGSVEFYLADFTDALTWKYAKDWMWLDLSSLGEVQYLGFELSSSDNGEWGMNTPAYFCFDNLGGEAPAQRNNYAEIINVPEKLYLIGDNQGWKPAEGIEMTKTAEGVFAIENVVMPYDNNRFAFTSVLGADNEDWTTVNTHRFGNDDANILNNETALVKGEKCFTLPQGEYNITVDFNNWTAVATEVEKPVEGILNNSADIQAEKVLRNGMIYIRKGGKTYTTVGQTINK